ncbi:MAG: helix-turn-helix domain-containing protein [Clostridiales bacterium]|nr:helix-turn-helix domain-containing protein [Clostridiales bacterium]
MISKDYSDLYTFRIKQLCKQRGISINKLSEMSGVRQSSIDNIINKRINNPGVVNLHKIAIAFNMTLAEFLDFKELNEFSFEDNDTLEE